MNLFVWKAPVTDDPDEAGALVERRFDQRDESMFEPSDDIGRFADALRALYPDDPDALQAEREDGPWSKLPFEQSDRLLVLNLRWRVDQPVLDAIVQLARDHELVIYDPHGTSVYLPDTCDLPAPVYVPTTLDWLKIIAIVAGFSALTLAAWHIPIVWLRWIAVAAGTFFTIAALIVVYGMLNPERDLPG